MTCARWMMVGLVGCAAGCNPWDFIGESNQLAFNSNLSRPHDRWNPQTRVAVGSTADFVAVAGQGKDGGLDLGAADASPVVPANAGLQVLSSEINHLTVRVMEAGYVDIQWQGPASDHFHMDSEPPVSGNLHDPVLTLANEAVSTWLQGGPWEDIGSRFLIANGASFRTEAELRNVAGEHLATDVNRLSVTSSNNTFALSQVDTYTRIAVGEGNTGATGTLTLTMDGWDAGSAFVRVEDHAQVTQLELAVATIATNSQYALKASAKLNDGGVLWLPPFSWEVDPGFRNSFAEDAGSQPFLLDRNDLLVVEWKREGPDGDFNKPVTVRLNGLSATASLPVHTPAPIGIDCGCSAAGTQDSAPAWMGLATLLVLRVVRRSQRSAPEGVRSTTSHTA